MLRKCVNILEINVHDDKKTVDIWLTKSEKYDHNLRERLKPLYERYKEKKYFVVMYESGEKDLYENTLSLLLYNHRRLVELKNREQHLLHV